MKTNARMLTDEQVSTLRESPYQHRKDKTRDAFLQFRKNHLLLISMNSHKTFAQHDEKEETQQHLQVHPSSTVSSLKWSLALMRTW